MAYHPSFFQSHTITMPAPLNCLPNLPVQSSKDKLENMDLSLNFPTRHKEPLIFTRQLWPNGWTYFKSQGARWEIWTLSFQWCIVVHCRSSIWSQLFVKMRSFLIFFTNCQFCLWAEKMIFENFFSKCSHSKTDWHRDMKPTSNGHKYSKFLENKTI